MKKKNWFWKSMMGTMQDQNPFFFCGGLRPPTSSTGAAPLVPACFWIEDSNRNRFALNGIQRITCYSFFLHNSKNKNWENLKFGFSFYPADCRSFMYIQFFFPFLKFTWKIGIQLNRKKNQILDFSNFYFSSYGHFCDVITPIFDEISR